MGLGEWIVKEEKRMVKGHLDFPEFSFGELDDLQVGPIFPLKCVEYKMKSRWNWQENIGKFRMTSEKRCASPCCLLHHLLIKITDSLKDEKISVFYLIMW